MVLTQEVPLLAFALLAAFALLYAYATVHHKRTLARVLLGLGVTAAVVTGALAATWLLVIGNGRLG